MPKGVPYLLLNVFFDRFAFGGLTAILAIFLHEKLLFDVDMATALYHINEFLLYLFAIVGAVFADSWWGQYKTISITTSIFIIGSAILTFATFDFGFVPIRSVSFFGLICVMIGAGAVKSCQNVLGGNLFNLPEESVALDNFFSLQFIVLKCGQFLGMILIPIFRKDFPCNGNENCYPLAYFVCTISMVLALISLWMGRRKYVHEKPSGNILIKVIQCIWFALKKKFTNRRKSQKSHWLEYSEGKYGHELIKDTKSVLNVLVIYLPLFIFWALLNQQMSRWVFQAQQMNGDLGFYIIKADQITWLGPFWIMVLVPFFNRFVFPHLSKIGLKTHLQRMGVGMFTAALSFVVSAYVEIQIAEKYISIFWLFPQYFLAALSEVFLWVSNVSFAYTEAPQSMKSVVSAMVYMSLSGGSLIVFLISGTKLFESQFYELIFFACLMFVDMIIFIILAVRYKYVTSEATTQIS